jgi:hypothetical protein
MRGVGLQVEAQRHRASVASCARAPVSGEFRGRPRGGGAGR